MTRSSIHLRLDRHNGRKDKLYKPRAELLAAANTALLLEAPLLLCGEPGCGKTDFAWYAARALAKALASHDPPQYSGNPETCEPLTCYIRSDTRARDLLYHYDALARFADAQHPPPSGPPPAQNPCNYITLRPLGVALMSEQRRVVLIDEIDKAPRDLPNDLLQEMDQGGFEIAEITDHQAPQPDRHHKELLLRRDMRRDKDLPMPLVLVTSNAERQLPDAFLRRCVFFFIKPFERDDLMEILREHFADRPGPPAGAPPATDRGRSRVTDNKEALLAGAVSVFSALQKRQPQLVKRPGTAELLQWVRTLLEHPALPEQAADSVIAAYAEPTPEPPRPDWGRIPALHCLVKLREDLEALGVLARA